jgi:hypothetical protein
LGASGGTSELTGEGSDISSFNNRIIDNLADNLTNILLVLVPVLLFGCSRTVLFINWQDDVAGKIRQIFQEYFAPNAAVSLNLPDHIIKSLVP